MSSRKVVVLGGGVAGEHFVGALRRLDDDSENVGGLDGAGVTIERRGAAADLCGREVRAGYRAIPAGIFTDPEVGTVGETEGVSARYELESTPPTSTYERPSREGVCVGPQATEWLGQLTLAVREQTPLDVLLDTIQPYPTFSEAIFFAVQELAASLS